ncbi:MAG: glycoside hydrolase family 38 C-terminal domain-containing protein, partial [Chloroflexota bacterium]
MFNTDRFKIAGLLYAVGHSHLDIVYQWPHREYIRKVGRTHATMLRMMEQYSDFKFSQSSAKIYADMKEHFPGLYEQVKTQIKAGRWQPVGAFWLEPDCNLISGESLVRHILHGQRFWQDEFGFQSKVCWQPDVFGMSWALPQILQRSGIEVVVTNKLFVWNDTNKWTQNVFWWESIDGSRVLGVIPPGHFIGFMDPDHIDGYWKAFSNKEDVGEMIYTYGWGDGGGGVDPEMIECAMRYQDFPGMVPVKFSNPEDALLQIYEKAAGEQIPTWRDELYLETHRGTYTSKGALKKHNRRSEVILQQVETLAALAWINGGDYPETELDAAWKILLNTQFHDALPGTHITEVYHYLLDEYHRLYDSAGLVRDRVATSLFGNQGACVLLFNPSLRTRSGIVTLSADIPHNGAGQAVENLDGTNAVLVQLDEPLDGMSVRTMQLAARPNASLDDALAVTERTLENQYLRAMFADNGELFSLWDKSNRREVLVDGLYGNRFQMYEDRPGRYEAWDIISSYVEHDLPMVGETSLTIDERGPLRVSLRLVRTFAESKITQRISLTAEGRALTFETEIDWNERQRLLKVGFPVAVNAQHATYDIAYGTIQRATHRNTSHDQARFEVPAHWWMDLSEYGYGVALLNDSKYGHEAHHEWMYLTLLKGSILPDPEADLGLHHFTYALYPHEGDWREGDVIGAATALNVPLYAQSTDRSASDETFLSCDASNVTLEALKRAEDGKR